MQHDTKVNDIQFYIPPDIIVPTGLVLDEYIRKQDAVDALDRIFDNVPMELTTEILRLRRELRGLPSTDVVPVVHSRWIKTADGAECEKCGREAVYQIIDDHWQYEPFCPHCGSIMNVKE